MSTAFDTLKFANRLKAAGTTDKQAEAEAEALAEIFEVNWKELATKEALRLVREDLRLAKEELKRDLKDLEQRLTIKLGAMLAGAAVVIAALVKWL